MNEEFESLILVDDDGKEHEFEILEIMEIEDNRYAILLPLGDDYEEDEAVIMKMEKDEKDGEDVFCDIESDEEWEKVAAFYEAMVAEEEE